MSILVANRTADPAPLPILVAFFADLERRGVSYVVWKSLETLDRQLQGIGDMDLCFLPEEREEVHAAFGDHAILPDVMSTASVDEDIVVYRGFDRERGVFISLHAHFHCRFGSKNGKEYRYPHEEEMVRDWRDVAGVHRLADGHFMAVRVLAATVNRAYGDDFIREIGRRYETLDDHDRAVLDTALHLYLDVEPRPFMNRLANEGAPALKDCFATAAARLDTETGRRERRNANRKGRRTFSLRAHLAHRLRRSRCKLRRPAEIVLTGPDGSGKSTTCRLIAGRLSAIGSTYVVYLGRRKWSAPNRWLDRSRRLHLVGTPLNWLWPLTSTAEILLRLALGRTLWRLGVTVLYDRSVYDIELKFGERSELTARLACAAARRIGARHGDLRYFVFAAPAVAVRRKPPGQCTEAEVVEARDRFQAILDASYTPLDSTSRSAEDMANEIIADYFQAARHWPERI